jgi:hypothetical protein
MNWDMLCYCKGRLTWVQGRDELACSKCDLHITGIAEAVASTPNKGHSTLLSLKKRIAYEYLRNQKKRANVKASEAYTQGWKDACKKVGDALEESDGGHWYSHIADEVSEGVPNFKEENDESA